MLWRGPNRLLGEGKGENGWPLADISDSRGEEPTRERQRVFGLAARQSEDTLAICRMGVELTKEVKSVYNYRDYKRYGGYKAVCIEEVQRPTRVRVKIQAQGNVCRSCQKLWSAADPTQPNQGVFVAAISHAEKQIRQTKTVCNQRCGGLMPALTRF